MTPMTRAGLALTLLLVPQQHPMTYPIFRGLMNVLRHTARMYPVADAVADLSGDDRAGVRFAIVTPTDYASQTDPADDSTISYEQGFLLHDHYVSSSPGPDGVWGTADDDMNKVMALHENVDKACKACHDPFRAPEH